MNMMRMENQQVGKITTLPVQKVLLRGLQDIATRKIQDQLDQFTVRLADALMSLSENSSDSKMANHSFIASNLLKKNRYGFFHIASEILTKQLQKECEAVENPHTYDIAHCDGELSLVPFAEMEDRLMIGTISRPFEAVHDTALTAINIRLACLLQRHEVSTVHNPFRPAVFISALHQAWCEFDPDPASHPLVLPLLTADVFPDLVPVLKAVNDTLIKNGIVPGPVESYRIKKTTTNLDPSAQSGKDNQVLSQQLQHYFARQPEPQQGAGSRPADLDFGSLIAPVMQGAAHGLNDAQPAASNARLFRFLDGIQNRMQGKGKSKSSAKSANSVFLPQIKQHAPPGTFSRVDESTIDLLTTVFDSVFKDQLIQQEAKDLIGFLQMPLLKVALLDKDFFFKNDHPARQMIDLLSKLSLDCNQSQGKDDPLFQAMQRNVERVQQEFDHEISIFSEVVADLESSAQLAQAESEQQLTAPIAGALRQEKIGQATKAAKSEVATRLNTGEVAEFIESFLEAKWVPVLTIAYSVKDDKPHTLENAIKTMDDLIWSVKPKANTAERKELIAKLPSMLAMINKWLDVLKWEDAERLQFFAELAECHASIVRAPLELSPERQLEIAAEAAMLSAERRRQKLAEAEATPEAAPDASVDTVDGLQGGMWMEFTQPDETRKKVKLAWISPLRTLFIFSNSQRQESFSLPSDDLAQLFRDNKVHVVQVEGVILRALSKAMQTAAINDADMSSAAA